MANEVRIRIANSRNGHSEVLIAQVEDSPTLAFTVARLAEEAALRGYGAAVNKAFTERINFTVANDYGQPCDYGIETGLITEVGRYYLGGKDFHKLKPVEFRTRCQEWRAAYANLASS